GGFGNFIVVTHNIDGKTYSTLYAHLSNTSVSQGDKVSQGVSIGAVGNTCGSTGAHLHFEVHPGGYDGRVIAVDAINYLDHEINNDYYVNKRSILRFERYITLFHLMNLVIYCITSILIQNDSF